MSKVLQNIQIQDLELAYEDCRRYLDRIPNASISGMFKMLQRKKYLDTFGDYNLLSTVCFVLNERGRKVHKRHARYAVLQIKEPTDLKTCKRGLKKELMDAIIREL
jgi:hypothetical protein